MSRFLRFFLRLFVIAFGFVCSALSAALAIIVLNGLITPDDLTALAGGDVEPIVLVGPAILVGIAGLTGLVANLALLPAMAVVALAEISRRRDWLYYALGGGAVAIVCLLAAERIVAIGPAVGDDTTLVRAARDVAAGMLGGLVYWLAAGRGAGRWLDARQSGLDRPGG